MYIICTLIIIMYVAFSQELTSNCESSFGVQIVEYMCSHNGSLLEWIVEPIISSGAVRFLSNSALLSVTVGDFLVILDSTKPLISRLRIPDNALATATIICNREIGMVNSTYSSGKLNIIVLSLILSHVKY